jgi:hypothetical protein
LISAGIIHINYPYIYVRTWKTVSKMSPALVLTTVNAPYSKKLDAQELAYCLWHPKAAEAVPGHMSSFFGDVDPELQTQFAALFHVPHAKLVEAAKAFSNYSGASYPLAE